MPLSFWIKSLRNRFGQKRVQPRKAPRRPLTTRLRLEELEDRTLPSASSGLLLPAAMPSSPPGNNPPAHSSQVKQAASSALQISNVSVNSSSFSPNVVGVKDTTTLSFTLSAKASVTVSVLNSSGKVVASLETSAAEAAGPQSVVWNGKNTSGVVVPDGSYRFSITATPSSGAAVQASAAVTVDTVPPALTISSVTQTVNITNQKSASANGTTAAGATVTVKVSDGTTTTPTYNATVSRSGGWSVSGVDLSGLTDGKLTWTVTATDAAGNTTTQTATDQKSTLSITTVTNPVNIADQNSASIAGTAQAGASITVQVSDTQGHPPTSYSTKAASNGSWTVSGMNLSALSDGTLLYTVTATIGANSTVKTTTAVKDTVPPALVIGSPPIVNLANQTSVSITGTSEAGATVTVQAADSNNKVVSGTAVNTQGAWSVVLNLSTLADGPISYTVTATDPAGNPTTKTATAIKDTVAPGLAITNAPNITLANQTNITVSGTTEAGAAVTVQITDKNTKSISANAVVDSHGNWAVSGLNLSTLADGAITYTVTATDAYDNNTIETANVVKDTIAPTLTIASYTNPINLAADNQVSASGRTAIGDSVTVQVSDGANSISSNATVDGSGNWAVSGINVTSLLAGAITYTVTATDAYGNSTGKTVDTVKDTATPTVSITSVPSLVNDANQTSTSASGTTGVGDTVSLYVVDSSQNQTKTYTTTADGSGTWSISGIDVSGLKDGTLTYTATATDAYGNVSTTSATLNTQKETVAAALTITSVGNFTLATGTVPVAAGTSDPNDAISILVSDSKGDEFGPFITSANGNGVWSFQYGFAPLAGVADGTITYVVTATNADGNSITKTATALKITSPPALTITNAPNVNLANQSNDTISGTTGADDTVNVQIDDSNNKTISANAVVDSHGNWSVSGLNLSTLADGAITYTVTATDAAGNSSSLSPTATKATQAPALSILSYTNPINLAAQGVVTASGKTGAGDTVTVQVSDGTHSVNGQDVADANGNWSVTGIGVGNLNDGDTVYTMTATDAYGNSTTKTVNAVKDTSSPTVTISAVTALVNNVNQTNTTAKGTTGANDVVTLYVTDDGNPQNQSKTYTTTADGNGNWSISGIDVSGLDDGTLTYTAVSTNADGNPSLAKMLTTAKDTVAPSLSFFSVAGSDDYLPAFRLHLPDPTSVTVMGNAPAGTSVTLQISDAKGGQTGILTTTTSQYTHWEFDNVDISNLADGLLTYTVTATDANGNSTTETTTGVKYTDLTLNPIPTVTASNQTNMTVSGTTASSAAITVQVSDGATMVSANAVADSKGNWSVSGLNLSSLVGVGTISYLVTSTNTVGSSTFLTGNIFKDSALAITGYTDPINAANQHNVTVSGTSYRDAYLQVQVSEGTTVGSSQPVLVGSNGQWSANFDVSGLSDGSITFTATDEFGTSQSVTATKDTAAPALQITNYTDPINAANDSSVVVSGTTEVGATVTVQAGDGTHTTNTYTATVDTNGNWSVYGINVSALNDGTITYTATATDAVGNTAQTTATATKDTEAPVLTVSSYTGNYYVDDFGDESGTYINSSNVTAAAINGTTDPGATVAVHLLDANGNKTQTYYATANATTGAWSINGIDASSLVDGTVYFGLTATSTSGNTSSLAETATKNATPPNLTVGPYTNTVNKGNEQNVSISGTSDVNDAITVQVSDGKTFFNAYAYVGSWDQGSWSIAGLDVSSLADGLLTYTITATDSYGSSTTQTVSVTKDTVAPTVTLNSVPTPTDSITPTLSGTSTDISDAVTVYVYSGSSVSGSPVQTLTATVQNDGTYSVSIPSSSPLSVGTYTVVASQTNAAGNSSASSAQTFVVDSTVKPTVTLNTVPPPIGGTLNAVFSGTAELGIGDVTVNVYSGDQASGTPMETLTASVGSDGSYSLAAFFAEGSYTAVASQTDTFNNTGNSNTQTFTSYIP